MNKTRKTISHQTSLIILCTAPVTALLLGDSGIQGLGTALGSAENLYRILILYFFYSCFSFFRKKDREQFLEKRSETLFFFSLALFLFEYFYALNANMDYAQRFILTKGDFSLAPDSFRQRLMVFLRYLPMLTSSLYLYLTHSTQKGLLLTLLGTAMYVLAFPNPLNSQGFGWLGFIAYSPLFYIWLNKKYNRPAYYGFWMGILGTMGTNYWLGTFSLVSLQFISVVFLFYYLLFMPLAAWTGRKGGNATLFLVPAIWVLFDWFRSQGFLGYPWGMIGVSQYRFISFIQSASLTGVWGTSFLVYMVNMTLANIAFSMNISGNSQKEAAWTRIKWLGLPFLLIFINLLYGTVLLKRPFPYWKTVSIGVIQQNTDPRKDDYRSSYEVLKNWTEKLIQKEKPDLISWSETAFVPNIKRWGSLPEGTNTYTRLVHEFRKWQKETGIWLLTGNDDYAESTDADKNDFDHFNASVLFDNQGERKETYHKMKLVPFTEYFPYKKQLPRVYEFLSSWDVYLWEPGTERVIFNHPKFSFFTPICFEDGFPDNIRRFVLDGSDLILNISNDYWSLDEVEAWQHFSNSIFRAVENRKTLVRATASGVSAYVDAFGRPRQWLPCYEEGGFIAHADLTDPDYLTLYTRWGDWFVLLCLFLWLLFPLFRFFLKEEEIIEQNLPVN